MNKLDLLIIRNALKWVGIDDNDSSVAQSALDIVEAELTQFDNETGMKNIDAIKAENESYRLEMQDIKTQNKNLNDFISELVVLTKPVMETYSGNTRLNDYLDLVEKVKL